MRVCVFEHIHACLAGVYVGVLSGVCDGGANGGNELARSACVYALCLYAVFLVENERLRRGGY